MFPSPATMPSNYALNFICLQLLLVDPTTADGYFTFILYINLVNL